MMNDKMNDWWKKSCGHLGGIYPYYLVDNPSRLSLDIGELLETGVLQSLGNPKLDIVSVVEKLTIPYLLGDRTMLQGIRKAPWFHEYREDGQGNREWVPIDLPEHDFIKPNIDEYTNKLRSALLTEMESYVENATTVGVLLSGGMDSRIAAALLKELQLKGRFSGDVVALTWGLKGSRDVIYSQRIAERFGWDYIWFPINAEVLERNIVLNGRNGAEVSPFHFHAMEDVANLKGLDVIIAASYGDSVGRAEFSSKHLNELKSIEGANWDRFNLVKRPLRKRSIDEIKKDIFAGSSFDIKHRQFEIEQQKHYMRRMLQHCMQIIAKKIPFYQLFTSSQVFSLMWKLDPSFRDNSWYTLLLKVLPGNLLDIPWARTGKFYNRESGIQDSYLQSYHEYSSWLRNELKSGVIERIKRGTLQNLNVFNEDSLNRYLNCWSVQKGKKLNHFDHTISWLASLVEFVEINGVVSEVNYQGSVTDKLDSMYGVMKSTAYSTYLKRRGL